MPEGPVIVPGSCLGSCPSLMGDFQSLSVLTLKSTGICSSFYQQGAFLYSDTSSSLTQSGAQGHIPGDPSILSEPNTGRSSYSLLLEENALGNLQSIKARGKGLKEKGAGAGL